MASTAHRGGQPPQLKSEGFMNLSFVHLFRSRNIIEIGGQVIGTPCQTFKMESACEVQRQDSESRIRRPIAAWFSLGARRM